MGDLPIFVAHDSADVWAIESSSGSTTPASRPWSPACRRTTSAPRASCGATRTTTGGLLRQTGFGWWVARLKKPCWSRSISSAWITSAASRRLGGAGRPAHRRAAASGCEARAALFELRSGPGSGLRLPIWPRTSGLITPEVEALRGSFGLPGHAHPPVRLGSARRQPASLPHHYDRNTVVYTGTHDNDTTVGWWTGGVGHSTRSDTDREHERQCARRYLDLDGREVHWQFIRAVLASVADTAIIPVQDLLGLGTAARMNQPGTATGNSAVAPGARAVELATSRNGSGC